MAATCSLGFVLHFYSLNFSGIDAGFLHPNGTNYFFTDGQVHKLNNNGNVIPLCAA